MKFASLLSYIRKKNGLSASEIANRISVVITTYYAWEKDKFKPNVASLQKLEKALELPSGCLQFFYDGKDLRRIYVSHPLRNGKTGDELIGEVERNRKEVTRICSNLLSERDDILIISPIHAFSFIPPTGRQDQVFEQCKSLLELADELWVYGDWHNSEGCKIEIKYAEVLKIPILYKG